MEKRARNIKTTCAAALVLLIMLAARNGFGDILTLDPSQSIVHTTNWANATWEIEPPPDAIDIPIHGSFNLTITPGGTDPITGVIYPDRIQFSNIDVGPLSFSGRTWEFPSFLGFYGEFYSAANDVEGSEDPCFGWGFYNSGFCLSQGNFGTYGGSYDHGTLLLTGAKNPNWLTGSNGFHYNLTATLRTDDGGGFPVPEPSSAALLLAGVSLFLLRLLAGRWRSG